MDGCCVAPALQTLSCLVALLFPCEQAHATAVPNYSVTRNILIFLRGDLDEKKASA